MSNHTKGEWNYNETSGDIESGEDILARLFDCKNRGDAESDANGYLMAAAPKLLEAAERALSVVDAAHILENVDYSEQIELLQNAIAKARGEQLVS